MYRIPLVIVLAAASSTFALAASYSGTLVDASCYDKQKSAASCQATSATSEFALDMSGKVYKLDANGNSKATAALKNHTNQASSTPSQTTPMTVKVEGTESGDTITVQTIEIQ